MNDIQASIENTQWSENRYCNNALLKLNIKIKGKTDLSNIELRCLTIKLAAADRTSVVFHQPFVYTYPVILMCAWQES